MYQSLCSSIESFCAISCLPGSELDVIRQQHPIEPLVWLPRTLQLTFAEGIQMLNDAGYEEVSTPPRGPGL